MHIPMQAIAERSKKLADALCSGAAAYGVEVSTLPSGARVVDAGVRAPGSYAAGALLTELCQGGLATAAIGVRSLGSLLLPHITVESSLPRCANLTLQSAREFEGAMISGPVKLFLGEGAPPAAGHEGALAAVIQADGLPEDGWAKALAKAAGCRPGELLLVVAPQQSAAGSTQIAGRMNENMLFTMQHSLGYDSGMVRHILGYCPIGPYGPAAEGKRLLLPDDYLHYAAGACLVVDAPEGLNVQELANGLAFDSLPIYGRLFYELLEEAGGDFFKIPNVMHINKLAEVTVCDVRSGRTARAGSLNAKMLTEQLI